MNKTLADHKGQRSMRKFKQDQTGEPELEAILEAGIWAPSAMNQQKWHFTVVQDEPCYGRSRK